MEGAIPGDPGVSFSGRRDRNDDRNTVKSTGGCGEGRAGKSEGGEPEVPGRKTFPRRERLTKGSEFLEVYKQGRKTVGRAFVCYVVRREGQGRKFGMAVSRKVGNAVVRNRVKRKLRETYRCSRSQLKDDITIVIVARPAASTMSFAECEREVGQLFRKGGALSE